MSKSLTVVADDAIPFAELAFSRHAQVVTKPGRQITPDDVAQADAIMVRTRTKVNADLLEGSTVKFVGSGVIGLEHVDQDYLAEQGIGFASAQGCNANSVSEFVVAALLHLEGQGYDLVGKTMAVVGIGNVGKRVVPKMEALGLKVVCCDPPRQQAEGLSEFVSLDEALQADIITLHTPLTSEGEWATVGMLNAQRVQRLQPHQVMINAARGGLVDEDALVAQSTKALIIDCWANEPFLHQGLLEKADLVTPHIAGHSYDGKANGTRMIYDAFCEHFGIESDLSWWDAMPAADPAEIALPDDLGEREALRWLIAKLHPIVQDTAYFKRYPAIKEEQVSFFEDFRRSYAVRREWFETRVDVPARLANLEGTLSKLGFKVNVLSQKA